MNNLSQATNVVALQNLGVINFDGVEITHIEGGFGDGKRCLLAKDTAEIHGMELKEINQSLKVLIKKSRIHEGVHYIDMLDKNSEVSIN